MWYANHGHYLRDFFVRYKYEFMVHMAIIKPRSSVANNYIGNPEMVIQNKVSEMAYMKPEDLADDYAGASNNFYNR